MNPTRVVNIRSVPDYRADAQCVYIGRAKGGRMCSIPGAPGYLGNPFPLLLKEDRGRVIAKFEEYARERIATDPAYRAVVKGLRGKVLVCFCAPAACHGDVLARLADELNP